MSNPGTPKGGKKVCVWKLHEGNDTWETVWDTDCGGEPESDGTLEESQFIFCPYCGKKIKEKRG